MLPTSRYLGGITRPRELHVITRSTCSHLERLKADQSLPSETYVARFAYTSLGVVNLPKCDSDTPTVPECAAGPSRESGSMSPREVSPVPST